MIEDRFFLSKTDFDFIGKVVLLRIDCDVDLKNEDGELVVDEDFRLRQAVPTIKFLQEKGVGKIILLGHLGRPEGEVVEELRLAPVTEKLDELLNAKIKDQKSKPKLKVQNFEEYEIDENIFLLENLRFDKGEEENDERFAKKLAGLGEVYVNGAFGVSHREHASIVGIPKFLPSFLGLSFEKEMEALGYLRQNAQRPLVFILGGSKSDKLGYLEFLGEWCDRVLVGGKLPLLISNDQLSIFKQISNFKFRISNLKSDGRDIDNESIEKFKRIIKTAGTSVWAGPMGVYEEKENQKGTFEIAKAIADSSAYKVAGGGDTHLAISWLNLWDKFDFVSSGGGAMLAFLKEGTLDGIDAITEANVKS